MRWQWIILISHTLILLPVGLALAADRAPRRVRARVGRVRPLGWGVLLVYATVPLNTVPQLVDAPLAVILVCTVANGVLCCTAGLLTGGVIRRQRRRNHPGVQPV